MKEGRKAKEIRDKQMRDMGIPKLVCKNCGHHWHPAVVPVYPLKDMFVVQCPKCNTPKHTMMILTDEKGEVKETYSKPSDMSSR